MKRRVHAKGADAPAERAAGCTPAPKRAATAAIAANAQKIMVFWIKLW